MLPWLLLAKGYVNAQHNLAEIKKEEELAEIRRAIKKLEKEKGEGKDNSCGRKL